MLLVVVVLGLALAAFCFVDAYANVLRLRAPNSVLRFQTNDPLALAYAADRVFLSAPTEKSAQVTSQRMALHALKGALLNPVAVRLAAGRYEREPHRFITTLDVAQQLTRHDIATQLLLIEANVMQGNVVGALRSYDKILRRQAIMGDTLFPILAGAARDPSVFPALRGYMSAGAPWSGAFIDWSIAHDPHLATLLPVIVAARSDASGLSQGRKQALIRRLVDVKAYQAAITMYRYFRHDVTDDFASAGVFAPLDWELQNGSGLDSNVNRDTGMLHFTLLGESRGLLLRRLIAVKPGRYRLTLTGKLTSGSNATSIRATATCAQSGGVLATIPLGQSNRSSASFFDISPSCTFVWLTLDGATASNEAAEGELSHLGLSSS